MPEEGTLKIIHKLGLHECIHIETEGIGWYVFRVPGGWLYETAGKVVYVPFSHEFSGEYDSIEYEVI